MNNPTLAQHSNRVVSAFAAKPHRTRKVVERGDLSLQRQLLQHGREATVHIDRMLMDMPTLSSGIDLMAETYSPAELKILRRREKHTPQMRERLVQNVLSLAAQFFKGHPSVTRWPDGPAVREA